MLEAAILPTDFKTAGHAHGPAPEPAPRVGEHGSPFKYTYPSLGVSTALSHAFAWNEQFLAPSDTAEKYDFWSFQ